MVAPSYDDVRTMVIELTKGKVLVGHALWNDLAVCFTLVSVNPTFDRFLCFQVLNLCWNLDNVRDTALYYPLRKQVGIEQEGMYPSLKVLAEKVLRRVVQVGEHSSVGVIPFQNIHGVIPFSTRFAADVFCFQIEDAQVCLALYTLHAEEWNRGVKAYEDVNALLPNGSGEWYW